MRCFGASWGTVWLLLALAGCRAPAMVHSCQLSSDCNAGQVCREGVCRVQCRSNQDCLDLSSALPFCDLAQSVCVASLPDASEASAEVGGAEVLEAAPDASFDAAPTDSTASDAADAGAEASFDAAPEASLDASSEGAEDAAVETGPEAAPVDAGPPSSPQPLAPGSTAQVFGTNVQFRWSLDAPGDLTQLEVCADPLCASARSLRTGADVTSQTLPIPSPGLGIPAAPGVFYWRLRTVRGGVASSRVSPTWTAHLERSTGGPDTSWGTVADFDGDGVRDLAVGSPGSNQVFVYAGPYSPATAARWTVILTDPASALGDNFGAVLANAGDVDGDGRGDLLVSAGAGATERVYLYLGGMAGPGPMPAVTLAHGAVPGFGAALTSLGDLDDDGRADFAVSATGDGMTAGTAAIYSGRMVRAGVLSPVATLSSSRPGQRYGLSLAGGSDYDGDGVGDLLVGQPGAPGGMPSGTVWIYRGSRTSPTLFNATVQTLSDSAMGSGYGSAVSWAGNFKGTHHACAAVWSQASGGGLRVYCDYASGFPVQTPWASASPAGLALAPASLAGGEDLNGDGLHDVLLGGGNALYVLAGTATASMARLQTVSAPAGASGFAQSVGFANGDGDNLVDVVASANTSAAGALYLSLGMSAAMPPFVSAPMGYVTPSVASSFGAALAR